ncbi:MAG: ATP phosphoribosyltransferase regulatory subunit, partial [Planctomycetes bacterium]|nr:ATP phosphoribosyltransferase regulatory subunit [Planctomycetota bacterium]
MSKKLLRAIEGTKDLFAIDMTRFAKAMAVAEEVFGRYNYTRIITPIFEHTALFSRSIGEATDIVEKEMYTFGASDDSVSLRPEGTAPVIRSYIQNGQDKFSSF